MEQLISSGTPVDFEPKNKFIYSPLMAAAFGGRIDAIELLRQKGTGLHQHNRGSWRNVIHFASLGGVRHGFSMLSLIGCGSVDYGYEDILAELLKDPGLDLNVCDGNETETIMVLDLAAEKQHKEILKTLINQPTMCGILNTFENALSTLNVAYVEMILDAKPGVLGTVEMLRSLLSREDIQINQVMTTGKAALRCGIQSGSVEKVKAILEDPRLDINQTTLIDNDCDKGTALTFAVWEPNTDPDIIMALLAHPNINVNCRNSFGTTPFSAVASTGDI
ncbi:ankyrin repeat-containing domain protein [Aspergillus crustosus]